MAQEVVTLQISLKWVTDEVLDEHDEWYSYEHDEASRRNLDLEEYMIIKERPGFTRRGVHVPDSKHSSFEAYELVIAKKLKE